MEKPNSLNKELSKANIDKLYKDISGMIYREKVIKGEIRMKKMINLSLALFLVLLLVGCQDEMSSLSNFENNGVDKIVVTLAMGNPEYGADSKTITDSNEISEFIEVFNNGQLGGTVSDDDIEIGGASTYSFYKDEEVIQSFSFNVNDTKVVWYDDKWREVAYPEDSLMPFDLYEQSQGKQNIVDTDGNEMELIP